MNSSLPQVRQLFRRSRTARPATIVRRRPRVARLLGLAREHLEPRLALAVGILPGPGTAPWQVLYSTEGSNIFAQQVATSPQNLIVADNSSFNNYQTIPNISSVAGLVIAQGSFVNAAGIERIGLGSEFHTGHVLNRGSVASLAGAFGKVRYVVNNDTYIWDYSFSSSGGLSLIYSSTNALPEPVTRPTTVYLANSGLESYNPNRILVGLNARVGVVWSQPPLSTDTIYPELDVSNVTFNTANAGPDLTSVSKVRPGSGPQDVAFSTQSFQLPVAEQGLGIIPATLDGSFTVPNTAIPGQLIRFRAAATSAAPGTSTIPLTFEPAASFDMNTFVDTSSSTLKRLAVAGILDPASGIVSLTFRTDLRDPRPADPGRVVLGAQYMARSQTAPISFELAPGQTYSGEITVDLPTPNSTVSFNSPVASSPNVSLAATNINFNAPFSATNRIDIARFDAKAGVFARKAEGVAEVMNGKVVAVGIPRGLEGLNYTTVPTVTIVGNGGASATADIRDGRLVAINVTNQGSGYIGRPTVEIDLPSGLAEHAFTMVPGSTAVTLSGNQSSKLAVGQEIEVRPSGSPFGPFPRRIITNLDSTGSPGKTIVTLSSQIDVTTAAGVIATYSPRTNPVPERLNFNAAVTAQVYDVRIGDDPATSGVNRGRLFVSATGSLTKAGGAAANSIFVQADTADLVVEGTINASQHSYLMRSPLKDQDRAPFVFTTASPTTGASTGLITGNQVAITLGNELTSPDQNGAVANRVKLQTDITSLRVTAASQTANAASYPYDIVVEDRDNFAVDAVASSSGAISLQATNGIVLNSALETDGDIGVTVTKGAFTLSAPLSSTRGRIALSATTLDVRNSLRVLDAAYDVLRDDIVLAATAGSLTLSGQVTAVNGVRLSAPSGGGNVTGDTRIVARAATINAGGSIDVRTAVELLTATATGDIFIDELDDIALPILRSDGTIAIRAQGADPGGVLSPNLVALDASILGVKTLSVTAPRGSLRVTANTDLPIALGEASLIASGGTPPMQAAGAVTIRSTAGNIDVSDAPTGGGNAQTVRIVTAKHLPATFQLNNPGFVASTLTSTTPEALVIDDITLRTGDRVLVAHQGATGGQAGPEANGIYTVSAAGSSLQNWVLTRSLEYDTSSELTANTFFRVLEGPQAGKVYETKYTTQFGTSPLAVTTVANVGRSQRVRVATTTTLAGTYAYTPASGKSAAPGTIAGTGPLPTIDGVQLAAGDRVLVRLGANGDQKANGVYTVTSIGSTTPNASWALTRAADRDTGVNIELGSVTVDEGTFRTSSTGSALQVRFDSLGIDPLVVSAVAGGRPRTNIGTDDINDGVRLIVSSTGGSSTLAGTLGRMIEIQEQNNVTGTANPDQKSSIAFSSELSGPINLTQELPYITRDYTIDGTNRIAPIGLHTTTAGSSRLLVDLASGLTAGMVVTGPGLLDGTTIATVSGKALTLSQPASNTAATPPGPGVFNFYSPVAMVTGTASASVLDVTGTTKLSDPPHKGMTIIGPGLSAGTTITDIRNISLSQFVDLSRPVIGAPGTQTYRVFPANLAGTSPAQTRPSPAVPIVPVVINGQNITVTNSGGGVFRQSGVATLKPTKLLSTETPSLKTIVITSFNDFQDVQKGMVVTGSGIRPGTRIEGIDRTHKVLTLDTDVEVGTQTTAAINVTSEISGLVIQVPSQVARVTITAGGSGYSQASPPDVEFDPSPTGTQATGVALVNAAGEVTGVSITQAGSGYLSSAPPKVRFVGTSGAGAVAAAILGGDTGHRRVAGIYLGGFDSGAALRVDTPSSADVQIDGVEVGRTQTGGRLGNQFGISLMGASKATIQSSTVTYSTGAGLRVAGTAQASLAAVEIGQSGSSNAVGVEVVGGTVVFGADTTGANTRTAITSRRVRVDDVAGFAPGAAVTGTVGTDVRVAEIYKDVSGTGGLLVLSIPITYRDGDTVTIAGRPRTLITRNYVTFNQRGIDVREGDVTIRNTSITDSNYDGLRIFGGTYKVGNESATIDAASNMFARNGYFGIRFMGDSPLPSSTTAQSQWIRGVRLDGNGSTQVGGAVGKSADASANDVPRLADPALGFKPRASGLDRWGNRHSVAPVNPTMYVGEPLDDSEIDGDRVNQNHVVVGGPAALIQRIVLVLEDDKDGVQAASVVSSAFTVKYSADRAVGTFDWDGPAVKTLVAGTDYTFRFDAATRRVVLERPAGSAALPDGSYRITVANGSPNGVRDADGNGLLANGVAGAGTTAFVVVLDTGPRVAITSNTASLGVGQTATITFALSADSADFAADDVTVGGGTLSPLSGTGRNYTATFTPFPNSAAPGTISVAAGRFTSGGLGNLAGTLATPIAIDTFTRPSISITSSVTGVRRGETATITFILSEPSTDFSVDDVTVGGGTLSPLTGTGRNYTATFTPATDSAVPGTIAVAAGRFTSAFGQSNIAGQLASPIAVNTAAQAATISVSPSTLRAGQTASVTFVLNEPSTDFAVDDVAVSGGTLDGFSGSGRTYSATFTPLTGSTAPGTISVASGRFTDPLGNANVGSSLLAPIVIDTVIPSVSIATSAATLRMGQTATITFTLSEPAINFTAGDVAVTGGTLSGFSGSGTTYTAMFSPTAGVSAQGTVSIPAGAFTDAAGNPAPASALSPPMVIETSTPTMTVTSSSSLLRAGQTATVTFTASRSVSNFSLADVSVAGGTLSNFTGSGSSYIAVFTPATNSVAPGTLSVAAGAFTDSAGNANAAATLFPVIVIDTTRPAVVSIVSSAAALRVGETATISFTLSKSSPDFRVENVGVTGGSLTNFAGSGSEFSATFTPHPLSTSPGTVTVAAGSFTDGAGNANEGGSVSLTIAIDTLPPTVAGFSTTAPDRTYGIGESVALVATFSEAVQAGGTLRVALNTGATVTLTTDGSTTAVGSYVVSAGETVDRLEIVAIVPSTTMPVDLAGNPLMDASLPPPTQLLASRHAIQVEGSLRALTAGDLSTNPQLIRDVRQPVVRVPITFSTPVTRVTPAAFRLLINGRSVSLRGATITGSGSAYTLNLPARRTAGRGIYTLQLRANAGIRSVIGGIEFAQSQSFYWGRGRSVGFSNSPRLVAFASLR